MPYKPQSDCYRTIKGEMYENLCDVISEETEAAVIEVKELKLRHRVIKHPDGFKQLFVHADDIDKLPPF